ncbi:MAG: asparagine synthase (glutamine-hydrolyzing), partial [Planctomycetota bacterium]|nr:asparagine synthase (glutamine-hydrolyzing) [Planctomycetota bacterium]
MCGIAGAVALTSDSSIDVEQLTCRMLDALVHRGPDDFAYIQTRNLALGARRLSIIDLENGRQPMLNESRDVAVAQNGEIYNHQQLAGQLKEAGYRFRTRCDTETLLHGYQQWGMSGLLDRLRGMFALSVLDTRRRRLLLGRDRLGQKPLYYYHDREKFLFASELRALLTSGLIPLTVNDRALEQLLTVHFVPGDLTIVEGVRKLPAGSWLELDIESGSLDIRTYWELPLTEEQPPDEDDAAERVGHLTQQAVRRCLVADVPIGVFLSGGLDSSIAAVEAHRLSGNVRTFSIGFDDELLDERDDARRIAESLGTRHVEMRFSEQEALDLFDSVPLALDEPVGDPAALTVYQLAQFAAREGVKVVVSGEGADELFGGYDYYAANTPASTASGTGLNRRRLVDLLRFRSNRSKFLETWPNGPVIPSEGRATLSGFPTISGAPTRHDLLGQATSPTDWEMRLVKRAATIDGELRRKRYVDLKTWLPDDLLIKFDRMTMASSIEGRAPFLDCDLVEYAFRLPEAMLRRGDTCKWILRRSYEKLLPEANLNKRKQGFVLPLNAWIKGPLKATFHDVMGTQQADHINTQAALEILGTHCTGPSSRMRLLYAVYMYRRWY